MNLYISAAEYDYHTLLKVAEMAGLAGIIGFHEAGDGYLVTFPQGIWKTIFGSIKIGL